MSSKFSATRLRRWARFVRRRDKLTCQMCACKKPARRMQVHHIWPKSLYPAKAYDLDNGIVLCGNCHNGIVHAENAFADQRNWEHFVPMFKARLSGQLSTKFNMVHQGLV